MVKLLGSTPMDSCLDGLTLSRWLSAGRMDQRLPRSNVATSCHFSVRIFCARRAMLASSRQLEYPSLEFIYTCEWPLSGTKVSRLWMLRKSARMIRCEGSGEQLP